MKAIVATLLFGVLVAGVHARDAAERLTPAMQSSLDAQKRVIAGWAASSVLVEAVKAQNQKGPIPGLTNRAWKRLPPTDPLVQSFERNAAGVWLARKLAASGGVFREAFLNAAQGEKVAFVEKTSSYLHAGEPKFDQPMSSGRSWEGKPEFDKSSGSYDIQVAVPVMSRGRATGVLVVGVSMKEMRDANR